MNAAIITTCRGRLHHLKLTLYSMLNQKPRHLRVLVVDYDCPDNVSGWAREHGIESIKAGIGREYFNLGHARNCGARHMISKHVDVLFFIDADVFISPVLVHETMKMFGGDQELVLVRNNPDYCPESNRRFCPDVMGSCAVRADAFVEVRGYDEGIHGWGADDIDLYDRITELGGENYFRPTWMHPITHSDRERTANYQDESKFVSQKRNAEYLANRKEVNPSGWGNP